MEVVIRALSLCLNTLLSFCLEDTHILTPTEVMCLIITAMPKNAQAKVEHNEECITALLARKYEQDALNGTVEMPEPSLGNVPLSVANKILEPTGFVLSNDPEYGTRGTKHCTVYDVIVNRTTTPNEDGSNTHELPQLTLTNNKENMENTKDEQYRRIILSEDGSSDFTDSHNKMPLKKNSTLGHIEGTTNVRPNSYIKHIKEVWTMHEMDPGQNGRNKKCITLFGRHIHEMNPASPLLVPDVIVTKSNGKKIKNHVSINNPLDLQKAREEYRESLLSSRTFTALGTRQYLNGHLHQDVVGTAKHHVNQPYILTSNKEETTKVVLSVDNQDSEVVSETVIILQETANKPFLEAIAKTGADLVASGHKGVRDNNLDFGTMHGLGIHYIAGDEMEYSVHNILPRDKGTARVSIEAKKEYSNRFSAVLKNIISQITGYIPESMGGDLGILHSAMLSVNLANASHKDIRDISMSLGTWVSGSGKQLKNWQLVFPDVIIFKDGTEYHGLIIVLSHGTQVAWDGRVVRHCTAITDTGDDQAFSYFIGASGPLAKIKLEKNIGSAKNNN